MSFSNSQLITHNGVLQRESLKKNNLDYNMTSIIKIQNIKINIRKISNCTTLSLTSILMR